MDSILNLLSKLTDALSRLQETKSYPEDLLHQDSKIQRFEFTFELCWKLMQEIERDARLPIAGARNTIRQAAQLQLIEDPAIWFEFLELRNETVHLYQLEIAKKVAARIPSFIPLVEEFLSATKKYLGDNSLL